MKWVRIDCTLDDHPDILEAGWQGRDVFEALLRTSKKFDLGGVIPAKFAGASYLARQLGMDSSVMISGLENAARVSLIEIDGEGNVCIPGWDEFNGEHELQDVRDKAKLRKQRQRERQKEAMSRDGHVTVTGQNVTGRDCHDVTGDGTGRDGTVHDGTGRDVSISYPSGTLAPSPRKAKAPKHDKPALNMETWEWENITDSYRKAWSEDFPGINLDDELRKARAWVRADPAKRRKKDWVRFLGTTWFKNAQERASSTQRIPIVDSRTTQLQSERAWQSVARMAAAMPTGDSLEAAMSMLPERTLDALKQWGKYPSLTIQNIGQMSYQQQETCHVAFCKAWLASEVVDKEEVES